MGLFDFLKKNGNVTTKKEPTKVAKRYVPIENASMPRNDNYAIAAFIRLSQDGASINKSNDEYARYLTYDYGVNNPVKYHKMVIAEGYLMEAGPEILLKQLKVPQLKEILENNNLPTKGKKEDLISRIADNINVKSLNIEPVYIPSPKGEEHLAKYNYIFRIGKYRITWQEFEHCKKKTELTQTKDIIWQILNGKRAEHLKNQSYVLAKDDIWYITKFLADEGNFSEALYHAIVVLYFDTSGYSSYGSYASYGLRQKGIDQRVINSDVAEMICRLKEYFSHSLIERCFNEYKLPSHLLKKPYFHKLVGDIMADKVIDINKYIK